MSRTAVTTRLARPGFSLIEASISVLLVGVLFVAAMNLVGASKFGQYKTADRQRGNHLAQALMTEILQQSYEEPVDTVNFGRESSESGGSRTDWDDVDDYDGWSGSPPVNRDGSAIANLDSWERRVTVERVSSVNTQIVSMTETGVKKITVTALHNDMPAASLVAIRTSGWQDPTQ